MPTTLELEKITWCDVRLGKDYNWWCQEFNTDVQWDSLDSISIIDPRQMAFLVEKMEKLRDYGLDDSIVEAAFIPFQLEKTNPETQTAHLVRVNESQISASDEVSKMLFALPNILDESDPSYAEFLNHITRLRVDYLNDISTSIKITITELEEQVHDNEHQQTMEGKSLHVFSEIEHILDFVPAGYEVRGNEELGTEELVSKDEEDIDGALRAERISDVDAGEDVEFDANGNPIKKGNRRGRKPKSQQPDFGGSDIVFK